MGTGIEIKVLPSDFDTAIQQSDAKREAFEVVAEKLIKKLQNSITDTNWYNAQRETFEYGVDKMQSLNDLCAKNLYFLSSLLKQVQMDFEALDQQLAERNQQQQIELPFKRFGMWPGIGPGGFNQKFDLGNFGPTFGKK